MSDEAKLGRFGHHPDAATDFCIEVDSLEARLFDAMGGISKPGTQPEKVSVVLSDIWRALSFTVGGDENAVKAKAVLRQLGTEAEDAVRKIGRSHTVADDARLSTAAPELLAALKSCVESLNLVAKEITNSDTGAFEAWSHPANSIRMAQEAISKAEGRPSKRVSNPSGLTLAQLIEAGWSP